MQKGRNRLLLQEKREFILSQKKKKKRMASEEITKKKTYNIYQLFCDFFEENKLLHLYSPLGNMLDKAIHLKINAKISKVDVVFKFQCYLKKLPKISSQISLMFIILLKQVSSQYYKIRESTSIIGCCRLDRSVTAVSRYLKTTLCLCGIWISKRELKK